MVSFGGDKTKWLEFWDSFTSAAYDNRNISNVDKFDYLRKGVIEKVDLNKHYGRVYYLPHHPVITPQKSTTKLRLVYDTSAKPRKDLNNLN